MVLDLLANISKVKQAMLQGSSQIRSAFSSHSQVLLGVVSSSSYGDSMYQLPYYDK